MSEQQVKGGGAQRLCLRGGHAGEGATKVHWGGSDWEERLFVVVLLLDMYILLFSI